MLSEISRIVSQLEKTPYNFDPSSSNTTHALEALSNYTEGFYENLPHASAYQAEGYEQSEEDDFMTLSETSDLPSIINFIKTRLDPPGLNPASGGHLGYIPGGGLFEGAIGDYLAAVSNQYAGVFYASPGAVRLENNLIDWAGKLIGYDDGFTGNLTSGGSMANLIAISTARNHCQITSQKIVRSVIYTTQQTHHSLLKAIKITGLEECVFHQIAIDERFCMIPAALEKAILTDIEKGLLPFLIISNAGSTDVGAVDPLSTISEISNKYGLWHHVDAAYGGFFMLTEAGKRTLNGIALADSVILDPHKGLFLPYGSGIVLVKEGNRLKNTFSQEANYMQDTVGDNFETSPADLSPELSRHFRGLRMWIPLKMHGIDKFASSLEEKLLLAQYFHIKIQELGFITGPTPDLSVVLFRYEPSEGDVNLFNQHIIKDVHMHCPIFISSTTIDGKFWLRAAILSVRTHLKEVNTLIDFLAETLLKNTKN